MLLLGKPVVEKLKNDIQTFIVKHSLQGKKVTFFLLSDDEPSHVYVTMKKRYAQILGLEGEIIERPEWTTQQVINAIHERNTDPDCLGMIVQLPLADHLKPDQAKILSAMLPEKDLDGLNGIEFGKTILGVSDFLPATPKAVISILDYYDYGDMRGKNVMIIGQSNLVGKPLAVACMARGASVHSYNASTDSQWIRNVFRNADIVISATGVVHLLDASFSADSQQLTQKILIDVGRGIKDGKAVGDIDVPYFENDVQAITPVPGGVGPVTVACLFHNIISLYLGSDTDA